MSWSSETNIKGPKGDQGDLAEAPTDGQTYGRKNAAWNVVVSGGGTASSVTFTPAGNLAATNVQAALQELDSEKVAKAGDTMTGNLLVNKSNPSLVLQKTAAGQANQLAGYNGANPRWSLALGDSTAEGGSNAGSNFALYRYADAGGLIDTPLTIARTTGGVILTGPLLLAADPGVALGAATKQYVDNRPGGVIVSDTPPAGVPDNTLWWESDTGSEFLRYNDGNTTQWVQAPVSVPSGAVRYDGAQTLTAPQQTQARGNINAVNKSGDTMTGALSISVADGFAIAAPSGSYARIFSTVTGTRTWSFGTSVDGTFVIVDETAAAFRVSVDTGGSLTLSAGTFKGVGYACRTGISGGYGGNNFNLNWSSPNVQMWIDGSNFGNITLTSDYRIKKDVIDLPGMWATVKALRPIRYKHKDAFDGLFKSDDVERWGFIAHELQETMIPDAATGHKDEENLIQSPNQMTIIAALTKALQEAMTRIEALEGK